MSSLLSVGSWLAQNWMLLVLVAFCLFFVVTTFLKQKKEINSRNELANSLKKGTKIVTTAGVYGVIAGIEETTDGKVVTIVTGKKSAPTTMTIHINAIMGIDNKTPVKADKKEEVAEENNVQEEVVEEVVEESAKTETKESSTKKTSKK